MVRLVKPKDLIENPRPNPSYHTSLFAQDYKHDTGPYTIEQVVHVEASWHHSKGKGVVEETQFIQS